MTAYHKAVTTSTPSGGTVHTFKVDPLDGFVFDDKLRRKITSTDTESFGGEGATPGFQMLLLDKIEKARVRAIYEPKEAGSRRLGEEYLVIEVQFAPGKTRRILAFSKQVPLLRKAIEMATAEDSKVDYLNFAGEKITSRMAKGRNVPDEVLDTRGNLVAGIEVVMLDGSREVLMPLPGEALQAFSRFSS